MDSNPKIDAEKAAEEVKTYLDGKKMDLVDWGYHGIEAYPDPGDEGMPELSKFAAMWDDFFMHADEVTKDDGSGFPHEIVERYEEETKRVEDLVNGDSAYWERIQAEILPLYKASTDTSDHHVIEKFESIWQGSIRDEVFCDEDGNEVVNSLSLIDDMRLLIENQDLGKRAQDRFNELGREEGVGVEDEDAFRLLCKNLADKLILENWQSRWKAIKLFYDPMPMDVVTTQMWTNQDTGERKRGDVISKRTMPSGFVVKIL